MFVQVLFIVAQLQMIQAFTNKKAARKIGEFSYSEMVPVSRKL